MDPCVSDSYFPNDDNIAALALIQPPVTPLSEELAASENKRLKEKRSFILPCNHCTLEDKGMFMDEL